MLTSRSAPPPRRPADWRGGVAGGPLAGGVGGAGGARPVRAGGGAGARGGLTAELRYREGLGGQLMLALFGGGGRADARTEYQSARDRLVDERGRARGEDLRRQQRAIRAQDASWAPPLRRESAAAD